MTQERLGILPPPAYRPVTFLTREIPPPSPLYIDEEDYLLIQYFSPSYAGNAEFHARFLSLDGEIKPIHRDLIISLTNTYLASRIDLEPGFLLSAHLYTSDTTIPRGAVYARLSIARSRVPKEILGYLLAQGFLSYSETLGWPPGKFDTTFDHPGIHDAFLLQDPAAGANLDYSIPAARRYQLLALRIPFTTSATVADRQVILTLGEDAIEYFRSEPAPIQTASLTRTYDFLAGWPHRETAFDSPGYIRLSLPVDIILLYNHKIRTSILNLQVDDDISIVTARCLIWYQA